MSRHPANQFQVKRVKRQIKQVQAILRRWDPIGIAPGDFAPVDEYDDYAPQIVARVMRGCSLDALTQHLGQIRTQIIGVEADPEGDRAIALDILQTLRSNPGRQPPAPPHGVHRQRQPDPEG